MTADDNFLNLIDKISIDGIEEQGDNPPLVPETSDKQENGPSPGHFEFQPLIEEEKKEFVNSLDARGKQILAELQGRARVAAIHGLPVAAAHVQGTEFTERSRKPIEHDIAAWPKHLIGFRRDRRILRDYIKATVGFEKLGAATGAPPKSLIRMFGPRGNPQAKNLFSVI